MAALISRRGEILDWENQEKFDHAAAKRRRSIFKLTTGILWSRINYNFRVLGLEVWSALGSESSKVGGRLWGRLPPPLERENYDVEIQDYLTDFLNSRGSKLKVNRVVMSLVIHEIPFKIWWLNEVRFTPSSSTLAFVQFMAVKVTLSRRRFKVKSLYGERTAIGESFRQSSCPSLGNFTDPAGRGVIIAANRKRIEIGVADFAIGTSNVL